MNAEKSHIGRVDFLRGGERSSDSYIGRDDCCLFIFEEVIKFFQIQN